MSGPCINPSQAPIAFFLGLKGDPGQRGPEGPASTVPGPEGRAGAVGVYVGEYVSNGAYNDSDVRRDIVAFGGRFWITNNRDKNGDSDWNTPTVDDWADFGDTLVAVATKLELMYDTTIEVGVAVAPPGFVMSENFVQYVSGWLLSGAGRLEAYDALIAGQFSTNSSTFNLARPNATMPGVAYAEFDISAILDAAIPENPTINNVTDNSLIFFGWLEGANSFLENRFGNTTQKFTVCLEGTGSNTSGGAEQFFIQLYYRTRLNGGAWGAWTVMGRDWYMNKLAVVDQSFQLVRDISIALIGDNDIQFSAGFSKGTGGTAAVAGAKISVKAYN